LRCAIEQSAIIWIIDFTTAMTAPEARLSALRTSGTTDIRAVEPTSRNDELKLAPWDSQLLRELELDVGDHLPALDEHHDACVLHDPSIIRRFLFVGLAHRLWEAIVAFRRHVYLSLLSRTTRGVEMGTCLRKATELSVNFQLLYGR
jgi:hypothetical protein